MIKKTVYLLINSFDKGGAETQAFSISKRFFFDGIFVVDRAPVKYDFEKKPAYLLRSLSKVSSLFKMFCLPIFAISLGIKVPKGAIVISFLERSNFINILSSLITLKNKSIVSVRTNPSLQYDSFLGRIQKILIKSLFNFASKVVTNSVGTKNELITNFGIREDLIEVIPNGFFINEVKLQSQESVGKYSSIFNNKVLICCGRFVESKGYHHLLRIFKELKKTDSKLKLVLVGDGPELSKNIELAKNFDLKVHVWDEEVGQDISNDDVYFLGYQSNPYKFIRRSSLFIFASMWEGMPNVLIESLICGCPVVSSRCDFGPEEIINSEDCGVLLPVHTVDNTINKDIDEIWINKIKELLNKPERLKELMDNGLIRSDDFDMACIVKKWEKVTQNVKSGE